MTKHRIMVVDDSATIRKMGQNVLEGLGCEVLCCEDGYDALTKIEEFSPDIVIADLMMPKLDGLGLCAVIKRNPSLNHIEVIMLTAKSGTFDEARGKMAGATLYLAKPMATKEVARHVEEIMARKQSRGTR